MTQSGHVPKAQRAAVASLAGLFMDRLQEVAADSVEGEDAVVTVRQLQRIWGEVLQQFTAEPSKRG